MPKSKLHWAHDLLAVALVGGIGGLVFWLLPPDTPPHATAALSPTTIPFATSTECPACSVVFS